MARNITLTLGAALEAGLGPNFNLTANVGVVTPSTATRTELIAGKSVSVDDLATQVTVTSTGTCTNAITQTIPCASTSTTTTEAPTTTTTTVAAPTTTTTTIAPIVCTTYNIQGTGLCEYEECDGTPLSFFCDTYCSFDICTNGVLSYSSEMIATVIGDCSPTPTTTTTAAPTTTTTTDAGTSLFVYAKYINSNGNLQYQINGGPIEQLGSLGTTCDYVTTIGVTVGDEITFSSVGGETIASSTSVCPDGPGGFGCSVGYSVLSSGTQSVYITIDGTSIC